MKYLLPSSAAIAALTCACVTSALAQSASSSPAASWVEPHPEIPYLPKPAAVPADWLAPHQPVTAFASPEARALLAFLYAISNKYTVVGQHNYAARQSYSTDLAARESGKTPALYGTDLGFAAAGDKDSAYVRHETVKKLIEEWRGGSIIALCWHAPPPTMDEPVTFHGDVQSHLTDQDFADLLTPGTKIYKHWCVQVDMIAEYLKELQDAHVPILWRPYHEINGDWFWWNGRRGDVYGSKALYRQLFNRLVGFHHLNNLIWVWNCDRPVRADRQFVDYFPGADYVDVLGLDCYGPFEQSYYDEMNALSGGKVMAIAETSHPPAPDIYRTQPKWAYFMRWAVDTAADRSSHAGVTPVPVHAIEEPVRPNPVMQAIAADPRMLSLQDPAFWNTVNAVRKAAGLPVITSPPPLVSSP